MATLDWFIRGATVGLCFLLATRLLLDDKRLTARLGALFIAGIACYVLVSAAGARELPTALVAVFHGVAIFNVVFFWWFSAALFENDLRWPIIPWLPVAILFITLPFRAWHAAVEEAQWVSPVHQIVVVILLLHVLYLAVRDFKSDLVETRRYFRRTVATLIPLMALAIVAVEIGLFGITIDNELLLLQAVALLLLVGGFTHWILRPREDLFSTTHLNDEKQLLQTQAYKSYHHSANRPHDNSSAALALADKDRTSFIDNLEIERLGDLMATGAYRKPGLTVGGLAESLSMPEHRVRELINKQLGYRNFTAYLNDYRIEEVKSKLADPGNSRIQIAQIAYDAGFNSIGPFNRAFRQATQKTPTEYRRQILADSSES